LAPALPVCTTSIAAYSTRARAGAPVSAPVTWERLARTRGGNGFSVLDPISRNIARATRYARAGATLAGPGCDRNAMYAKANLDAKGIVAKACGRARGWLLLC